MGEAEKIVAQVPKLKFADGHEMPMVALGTYFGLPEKDFIPSEVTNAVKMAIDIGYRHIDTAWLYQTEPAVGQAIYDKIKEGVVDRKDLFITSKLSFAHMMPADIKPVLRESLAALRLDYVDLYLIHWPFAVHKLPDGSVPAVFEGDISHIINNYNDHIKTWKVLEECVDEGLVKSIGISNFTHKQVQNILDNCRIKPATIQIEIHPYFSNEKLVKYCQERGVTVTAYTPLGQPHKSWSPEGFVSPLENPVIVEIAKKHGKSPGQVALRYQTQRGIAVPSKSSKMERLRQNIQIFDFKLSKEDMDAIAALNRNSRANWFLPLKSHKDYPFMEEF